MKLALRVLLLALVALLLLGQTGTSPSSLPYSFVPGCAPHQLWCLTALAVGRVEAQALKLIKEESTLRMTGQVKMSTAVMVLTADEADYHLDTNDIEHVETSAYTSNNARFLRWYFCRIHWYFAPYPLASPTFQKPCRQSVL